jgi:exopolysaccharide production protein ExoZ
MGEFLKQKFELHRGGGAINVRSMEGLRGFAVSLVFLVHYVTLVKPWISDVSLLAFSSAIRTIGNTGVDLFFVLSGYLIYGSLISRPQSFLKFMLRRLVRIYPAFTAVFVIYIILSFVFPAENKIPWPILKGLLYVAANFFLLPGIFPIDPIITVAWSLSYEIFYYLTIPVLIVLFRLRQRSSAWRVWFFSAAAAGTLIYCAAYGGHVRLIMFISGILLHEAHEGRRMFYQGGFIGLLALTIGLLSTLVPMTGSAGSAIKVGILFGSFFLLCLACIRDSSAPLPRTFSWTPLRWLGNISYSYYLLHGLALKAAFFVLSIILPQKVHHGNLIFWGIDPLPKFVPTKTRIFGLESRLKLLSLNNLASPFKHPRKRLSLARGELATRDALYYGLRSRVDFCHRSCAWHLEAQHTLAPCRNETLHAQSHRRDVALQGHMHAFLNEDLGMLFKGL